MYCFTVKGLYFELCNQTSNIIKTIMFSCPIRLKLNGQNTFSKSTSSKTSFHQYLSSFIKIQVFLLHQLLSQDIFEKVGVRMHYLSRICMFLLLLDIAMVIGLDGYCDGYVT